MTTESSPSQPGSSNSTASASSKQHKFPSLVVPRIHEVQLGESISHRSSIVPSWTDLGQPDLIHLTHYNKSSKQEMGVYHYASGLDLTSSLQVGLYLQTIQSNDPHKATDKHPKIGTYIAYNIFTRGDLHIRYSYPNSSKKPQIIFHPANKEAKPFAVQDSYDGTLDEKSLQIWNEIQVSSIIRSIIFADDFKRQLPGMVKYNMFQSTKDTKDALKLLIEFIPMGVKTNSSDYYNLTTVANNHLIDSILKLLSITHLYDLAIEELDKINSNGIYNVILIKFLVLKGDHSKAFNIMYEHLKKLPNDGWMLNEQVQLLLIKNRPDLALTPAQKCIIALPTECSSWFNLCKVYILKKDFKMALLTLNSSPMYLNKKKDIFKALEPKKFELPEPTEGKIDSIWSDAMNMGIISGSGTIVEFSTNEEISKINPEDLTVDQEGRLHCSFTHAYHILAILNKQMGWKSLIELRSQIFWMENDQNEDENALEVRNKRVAEQWLDSLFVIFYLNMKRVLVWKKEFSETLSLTPLQWELIGDEFYKIHHFKESLWPYSKSLIERFSIFISNHILDYWFEISLNWEQFHQLHLINDTQTDYMLDMDILIDILLKTISWQSRFYNEFPLKCLLVLKVLISKGFLDLEQFKARDLGPMEGVLDRMVNWLDQFE